MARKVKVALTMQGDVLKRISAAAKAAGTTKDVVVNVVLYLYLSRLKEKQK